MDRRIFSPLSSDVCRMQSGEIMVLKCCVGYNQSKIIRRKIKWQRTLIEQCDSIPDFRSSDLQIKDRVLNRLAATLRLGLRLIRRSVGINNEMEYRTVGLQIIEVDLWSNKGKNLYPHINAVHMRIRNLARSLQAMDRQTTCFECKIP